MVRGYLDHLTVERGRSSNTLSAYRRDLDRYVDWLSDRDIKDLSVIQAADVHAYIRHLSDETSARPLSPRSIARCVSTLRGLHKFAYREGIVGSDPTSDVATPKATARLPKAIGVDDVTRLLDAASIVDGDGPRGLRNIALLEFLYGTGARVSEAVGVDIDDVDTGAGQVVLHGKGERTRIVPLGSFAIAAIEAYKVRGRPALTPRAHHKMFVNSRGGPLTRQGAHLILSSVAECAGLPPGIGPHTLRHSFATHLLDGGADIRVVQELLGHASVSTTQIYTLVTIDKLREVYATSHPRAQ